MASISPYMCHEGLSYGRLQCSLSVDCQRELEVEPILALLFVNAKHYLVVNLVKNGTIWRSAGCFQISSRVHNGLPTSRHCQLNNLLCVVIENFRQAMGAKGTLECGLHPCPTRSIILRAYCRAIVKSLQSVTCNIPSTTVVFRRGKLVFFLLRLQFFIKTELPPVPTQRWRYNLDTTTVGVFFSAGDSHVLCFIVDTNPRVRLESYILFQQKCFLSCSYWLVDDS